MSDEKKVPPSKARIYVNRPELIKPQVEMLPPHDEPVVSVSKSVTRKKQDDVDVQATRSEIRLTAATMVSEAFQHLLPLIRGEEGCSAATRLNAIKLVLDLAKDADGDDAETTTVTSAHLETLRGLALGRAGQAKR